MEQEQDPGLTNFLPPYMPSDQKALPPGGSGVTGKELLALPGASRPQTLPQPDHLHHETYSIPPPPGASLVPMDSSARPW